MNKSKRMEVRIVSPSDAAELSRIIERDLPVVVTIYVSGTLFETKFKHYSIAKSAISRIAKENKLRLNGGVLKSKD